MPALALLLSRRYLFHSVTKSGVDRRLGRAGGITSHHHHGSRCDTLSTSQSAEDTSLYLDRRWILVHWHCLNRCLDSGLSVYQPCRQSKCPAMPSYSNTSHRRLCILDLPRLTLVGRAVVHYYYLSSHYLSLPHPNRLIIQLACTSWFLKQHRNNRNKTPNQPKREMKPGTKKKTSMRNSCRQILSRLPCIESVPSRITPEACARMYTSVVK